MGYKPPFSLLHKYRSGTPHLSLDGISICVIFGSFFSGVHMTTQTSSTTPNSRHSVEPFTIDIPAHYAERLQPLHPDGAQHAAAAALRLYLDLGELGVDALRSRATHEKMKPGELVLHLLAGFEVRGTEGTIITPAGKPKRGVANPARDAEIYATYKAGGTTYAKIAAQYNLSTIRVAQILAAGRATDMDRN
jgi:hypothetical protein